MTTQEFNDFPVLKIDRRGIVLRPLVVGLSRALVHNQRKRTFTRAGKSCKLLTQFRLQPDWYQIFGQGLRAVLAASSWLDLSDFGPARISES